MLLKLYYLEGMFIVSGIYKLRAIYLFHTYIFQYRFETGLLTTTISIIHEEKEIMYFFHVIKIFI